ncbi:hypothetical protein Tco_1465339 [Tanacetum coccineum]
MEGRSSKYSFKSWLQHLVSEDGMLTFDAQGFGSYTFKSLLMNKENSCEELYAPEIARNSLIFRVVIPPQRLETFTFRIHFELNIYWSQLDVSYAFPWTMALVQCIVFPRERIFPNTNRSPRPGGMGGGIGKRKEEERGGGGGEINVEVEDSFIFVTQICLLYLTYPEVSPLLSSTKNEDTIFDSGIST